MREEWKGQMANGQKSYTAGGRMRAPSLNVLCQFVINAWSKVKTETVMKSFRKCSISTALDDTEDDGLPDSDEDHAWLNRFISCAIYGARLTYCLRASSVYSLAFHKHHRSTCSASS
ncbi:hypothetical protein M514_26234 [Trichuris suis]|uniref:DDE-1 domain-containing protein n=1 Tax=Trichuris suis TaxID=68888 RepID=A0A085MWF0_9BILA|nr:hypothetical protein M514_26234 [Trichuris suis]